MCECRLMYVCTYVCTSSLVLAQCGVMYVCCEYLVAALQTRLLTCDGTA